MKKNNLLIIALAILVIGFIPFMMFFQLKGQISELKTEIATFKSEAKTLQDCLAEIQMLKDDQALMNYNQKQLIQAVDKFLDAWEIDAIEPSGYSPDEVIMLATIIDNEARNQPFEGKVAVGAVVINRVKSNLFKGSISEVILSPGQFCKLRYIGDQLLPSSIAAAKAALKGVDPTKGALFFYNPKTAESEWIKSRPVLTQIGDHVFAA